MSKHNYTVVIIEDDPLVNTTVKEILSAKYNRVFAYKDANEALEELHTLSPDLIRFIFKSFSQKSHTFL